MAVLIAAADPHRLEVRPGPPLGGTFRAPGDKSVTHRAILVGLIARGASLIEDPNPGQDCLDTLSCACSLGLEARSSGGRLELEGRGFSLREPDQVLDCGNSGTTLRLLSGILAGQPFQSVLSGDASLNRRPVTRIIEPLRSMGARLFARENDRLPPLVIQGGPLTPIDYTLPVASAQVASAVLLAGLQARGTTSVAVPGAARDHTERLLEAAGVPVEVEPLAGGGRRASVCGPATVTPIRIRVPGDFSAAAFFLAAAAAGGGTVTALGLGLNPTRTGLLDVLERMGAEIVRSAPRVESGEPVGDVTVRGGDRLVGFDVPPEWLPRLIDEVPAWAVAAATARGRSRLTGAGELRVKESDRIAALARNLSRVGVAARELPDGLEIEGGVVAGGTVGAEHDHRIAMAFAVLGTLARAKVVVEEAAGIATSFPGFAASLTALGGRVAAAAEPTP